MEHTSPSLNTSQSCKEEVLQLLHPNRRHWSPFLTTAYERIKSYGWGLQAFIASYPSCLSHITNIQWLCLSQRGVFLSLLFAQDAKTAPLSPNSIACYARSWRAKHFVGCIFCSRRRVFCLQPRWKPNPCSRGLGGKILFSPVSLHLLDFQWRDTASI